MAVKNIGPFNMLHRFEFRLNYLQTGQLTMPSKGEFPHM